MEMYKCEIESNKYWSLYSIVIQKILNINAIKVSLGIHCCFELLELRIQIRLKRPSLIRKEQ